MTSFLPLLRLLRRRRRNSTLRRVLNTFNFLTGGHDVPNLSQGITRFVFICLLSLGIEFCSILSLTGRIITRHLAPASIMMFEEVSADVHGWV
jgi:hypothetical protein